MENIPDNLMIRKNSKEDIDKLVKLWYEISLESHDFIDKEYWEKAREDMAKKYIPKSDTYIIEENNEFRGFISMVDNYLAAIFVDKKFQGKGYGKKLLDYAKEQKDSIELKVFKKNNRACKFYLRNGFTIKQELDNESLKEKEYLMVWKRL